MRSRSQSERYNAAEDLVERNLEAGRGKKVAYVDDEGSYSYSELAERVSRCANALLSEGIQPGERIIICLLDTIDFPACFLGAIWAGIVPIPINTQFQPADYAYILRDSQPKALVVSESLLPSILEAVRISDWRGKIIVSGVVSSEFPALFHLMQRASGSVEIAATKADDRCFWLYSSGSTGEPKGAVHRHASLVRTAELFGQGVLGMSENDVVYSAAKLFFAYGLGNALSFPLAVGGTTILHAGRAQPKTVCGILRKNKPTIFCGVPTLFSSLLLCEELPRGEELSLRLCTSAGEALPEEIGRTWTARTGVEIVDGIGSTEMLHIFISNRPGSCRYGTTGQPVPGYKVRIAGESGDDARPGEMGDLYVSGPSAAACYWNKPEKTQSTFLGEWVKTGDRFRQETNGDYVYCGRSDEMLKVSGQWVSPIEVESALIAHGAVLEAAVVGASDENELVKPKAFVVVKPGVERSSELVGELKDFVKGRLAPHKYPRWIEFVEELPKTATGKIRRNVLRASANEKTSAPREPKLRELRTERDFVTVDGKRLETVWHRHSKQEKTIVMLHEGLGSISLWKNFPEQIAKATGCGVLAYSRYGHGKSEKLAEKRSVDFMHHEAQVVLPELLARCEIQTPILLGHSDGGSICILYAATAKQQPLELILEAPHVFVEDLSVQSIAKIGEVYRTTDLRKKLGRYHDHVDETFWGWNDIWLEPQFRSWNIESYLVPIACPTLVIQGENDEYGTLAQVEAIKARVPGTETLVLPKCGHSPHRDQPEMTLAAITEFVQRIGFAACQPPRPASEWD